MGRWEIYVPWHERKLQGILIIVIYWATRQVLFYGGYFKCIHIAFTQYCMELFCVYSTEKGWAPEKWTSHSLGVHKIRAAHEYGALPRSSGILSENYGSYRTWIAYTDRPASFFFDIFQTPKKNYYLMDLPTLSQYVIRNNSFVVINFNMKWNNY